VNEDDLLRRDIGRERERQRVQFNSAEGGDHGPRFGAFVVSSAAFRRGEDATDTEQRERVLDEHVEWGDGSDGDKVESFAERRVAASVLDAGVDHLNFIEREFAGGGFEELAAATLRSDQDELERWFNDAHGKSGEAAARSDVGDAGWLALGEVSRCAQRYKQCERLAEESMGDCGGLGDGGEAGSLVAI
jgi:hypothetical protein